MGLLDSVLGGLTSGGSDDGADAGGKASELLGLLGGGSSEGGTGGLGGVLASLSGSGLENKVASWVGSGDNDDVSGDEVEGAIGSSKIEEIAEKLGLPKGQAASMIAGVLPGIIDKLTPNGRVED